jgi:class 3 adenylate cyclase
VEPPETRYAKTSDGIYLAYQTVGDGPVDLAWQLDIFGDVDLIWETPLGSWFEELTAFSRLILHDRRGTGLSSRNVPPPDLETRVADLGVVLDAARSDRPVLGGGFDSGAPNVMFAGSHPERVHSLVWWEPQPRNVRAPDFPWGVDDEYLQRSANVTKEFWGTDGFGAAFAELEGGVGHDVPPDEAAALSRIARHTVTPDVAIALDRMWEETDVRAILPSVNTPTLLLASVNMEIAAYVASQMPNATLRALPGSPERDDPAVIAAIREWVGAAPPAPDLDRVLATVLFTDIVGSTERLAQLGDDRWRSLVARHDDRSRAEVERHRGRFVDSTGDGLFATFDGPARAVRCAQAIGASLEDLGIRIRAGVHTGEVILEGEAVRGIAVHVGARVAALAGASEVLVSQTVKDLVVGSGLTFEDAGEHELKGVPDRWHLYRVVE